MKLSLWCGHYVQWTILKSLNLSGRWTNYVGNLSKIPTKRAEATFFLAFSNNEDIGAFIL